MATQRALAEMRKKYREELESKKDIWTAPEGISLIRVQPEYKKNAHFFKEVVLHFRFNPDGGGFAVCPGESCSICKKAAKLALSENPKKQKRAMAIAGQYRAVIPVCVLKENGRKLKKRWRVWPTSKTNLNDFLACVMDNNTSQFMDPKIGRNFTVHRKGKNRNTRWKITIKTKPTKLKSWKQLKKKLINLDERYKPTPNSKIKLMLSGKSARDEE